MAITEIVRQKRMYFFTGYLVEVVLENSGIGFRGLFLVLMPAKISPPMNITPPPSYKPIIFQSCFDCKIKNLNMPSIATCNVLCLAKKTNPFFQEEKFELNCPIDLFSLLKK